MRVCKHGCDVLDSRIFGTSFIKAIEHFFGVYIASSKYSGGWENSRKLCKPSTTSRVCITVSNSPDPPQVSINTEKVLYCLSNTYNTYTTIQLHYSS